MPDLIADSDSDKRRDSFGEGTIEFIRTYELDHDNFPKDKSAMLASMAVDSTYHQPIVPTIELVGGEEVDFDSWVDDDSVSPLTRERKRVASTETGSESPPKRTLTLRGTEMWKAMYPRDG